MKTQVISAHALTCLVLLFVSFGIFAYSSREKLPVTTGSAGSAIMAGKASSYRNSLVLDNRPLDYTTFSLASKGKLAVISGDPTTTVAAKIPFRIYLKRNEKLINNGASATSRTVSEIDIASVLVMAKPGDFLVIEPTRKEDATARRTIRLIGYFDYFLKSHRDLFSFWPNKGAGC